MRVTAVLVSSGPLDAVSAFRSLTCPVVVSTLRKHEKTAKSDRKHKPRQPPWSISPCREHGSKDAPAAREETRHRETIMSKRYKKTFSRHTDEVTR